MQRAAVLLALALASGVSLAQGSGGRSDRLPLLTESEAGAPHLSPSHVVWSPDSTRLVFVAETDKDGGHAGDLMEIEAATAKTRVLLSKAKLDALTPEPASGEPAQHYAAYASAEDLQWSPDGKHLLFDRDGALWWVDVASGHARHLVDTGGAPGDDPKVAPDSAHVSYLRDHNILTVPVTGGDGLPLMQSATSTLLNGEVDWIYEEELETKSNYFWSPDSRRIAYLQMDEAKVPEYPLVDWIPAHAVTELQRYPQPGDPNPAVRVGVIGATGGETRWIDLPLSANNDYVPRLGWMDDHTLWVEVLRRNQRKREFFLADATTGAAHAVATDEDSNYLNMNYDAQFLEDGRFLFSSWRDGHTHLYLYRADRTGGGLPTQATLEREIDKGNYEVGPFRITGYHSADAKAESEPRVLFISNESEPIGRGLWVVGLDGAGKQGLTPAPGTHEVQLSPNGAYFIDTSSAYTRMPAVALCTTRTVTCKELDRYTPPAGFHRPVQKPLTVKAGDGTVLYGLLELPGATTAGSVPLIVNPYGGPAVSEAADEWTNGGFDRVLAEHGFAVLHADNRGMGGRGRAFEQQCYRAFGPVELADQLTVLDSVLKQYPQLDGKRLGWYGYSWGGTFTLYAMSHSSRFLAGMEGAGVTDWRNYDSIYTERYMGLPEQEGSAYRAASVIESAPNLKGSLLIEHGTGDDNVHIQNTFQLIQALIKATVPYDLELSPRATHRQYEPESTEGSLERMLAHFETYVKNARGPVGAAAGAF